mmetsp:Transcript_41332/g.82808  ORF Transcript_41332/g.82808 Transcript_41332/m.82808 type:complete len:222 (-) Transcript_41332:48-713(-)
MSALQPSHYALLGLDRAFTPEHLKKQYRMLALRYHPDRNRGNEDMAGEKFKQVQEAFSILSDPESRRVYDMEMLMRRARVASDRYNASQVSQPPGERAPYRKRGASRERTPQPMPRPTTLNEPPLHPDPPPMSQCADCPVAPEASEDQACERELEEDIRARELEEEALNAVREAAAREEVEIEEAVRLVQEAIRRVHTPQHLSLIPNTLLHMFATLQLMML